MPRALNSFDQTKLERRNNNSVLTLNKPQPNIGINNVILSGDTISSSPSDIVSSNLACYIDFGISNCAPGSVTAFDLSPNKNDCSLLGGAVIDTEAGGNLSVRGAGNYGSIAHSASMSFSTALTLSVWYNTGAVLTASLMYLKGRTDTDVYNPLLAMNGYYAWTGSGGRCQMQPSASYAVANTWYNLVASHTSGTTPTFYLNGVVRAYTFLQGDGTQPLGTNTNPVGIAADVSRGAISAWRGNLGSLMVYNRALSAAEVLQNFEATRRRFGV